MVFACRGRRVLAIIQMLTAIEMLLMPVWAGAAAVRTSDTRAEPPDGRSLARRLGRLPAPVVLAAAALLAMAAFEEGAAAAVLRSQAVALGWLVLLAGLAVLLDRVAGPRPAQILTALAGWALLAGIILAGPAADLADGSVQAGIVRLAVHANPLVVAERELGLDWLHMGLTYRLTPLGESYGYLVGAAAWWKTFLAHVFVGSGLLVFGSTGGRAKATVPQF